MCPAVYFERLIEDFDDASSSENSTSSYAVIKSSVGKSKAHLITTLELKQLLPFKQFASLF